jgi:hypothetical protein
MFFEVWTVRLWRWEVAVIRREVTGWSHEAELVARELQRARAAGSPLPQAHTHANDESGAGAAEGSEPLTVDELTAWYETRPHVRDARRVARAAAKRGIGSEEAADIREWLDSRAKREPARTSSEVVITDAEREWMKARGG